MSIKNRVLLQDNDEFRSSTGHLILLCVAHELAMVSPTENDHAKVSVPALLVYEGWSLCREHFESINRIKADGYSMAEIEHDLRTGNF